MKNQVQEAVLEDPRAGRNVVLGIYVILSTFVIASYTLYQYFMM